MKDWKKFLTAAGIRAIRTVAQTAIAIIGTSIDAVFLTIVD